MPARDQVRRLGMLERAPVPWDARQLGLTFMPPQMAEFIRSLPWALINGTMRGGNWTEAQETRFLDIMEYVQTTEPWAAKVKDLIEESRDMQP